MEYKTITNLIALANIYLKETKYKNDNKLNEI